MLKIAGKSKEYIKEWREQEDQKREFPTPQNVMRNKIRIMLKKAKKVVAVKTLQWCKYLKIGTGNKLNPTWNQVNSDQKLAPETN